MIDFLFRRLVLRRVGFTYSNFSWGLHGGVDVKWSRGLLVFGARLTWLWLGLKSVEDLSHYPQWGSTVRTLVNLPMGRFAWANHIYVLPNNPARLKYRYTSVPIEETDTLYWCLKFQYIFWRASFFKLLGQELALWCGCENFSFVRRKVNRPASSTWPQLARVCTPSRTPSWGVLGMLCALFPNKLFRLLLRFFYGH